MIAATDSDAYRNLMSYLLSNAVVGELTAIENYARMVPLASTGKEKLDLLGQAREEGKHVRMLRALGQARGFTVLSHSVEPEWRAIRESFRAAADKKDLIACLLIQEVMVETTAIVTYRMLANGDSIDSHTRRVAEAILGDELEHWETGLEKLAPLVAQQPESALGSLEWCHDAIMPELFSLANTSCEKLCDDIKVSCDTLDLGEIDADLVDLRAEATDHYLDTLNRIGFNPARTEHIARSMTSFESAGEGQVCC